MTERRRHRRCPGHGARVRIDGRDYRVHDLSRGGVRLDAYDGAAQPRQEVQMRLLLALGGEAREIPVRAMVLRVGPDGLAARFQRLSPHAAYQLDDYLAAVAED